MSDMVPLLALSIGGDCACDHTKQDKHQHALRSVGSNYESVSYDSLACSTPQCRGCYHLLNLKEDMLPILEATAHIPSGVKSRPLGAGRNKGFNDSSRGLRPTA